VETVALLQKRGRRYFPDLISGVKKTLSRYRPIHERREIINLVSEIGRLAARSGDVEMSRFAAIVSRSKPGFGSNRRLDLVER
jgi:hypothetical protein